MTPTVADVMAYVGNHFPIMRSHGVWRAAASVLEGPIPLQPGVWIALRGTTADGIYCADANGRFVDLPDGEWDATVYVLSPPAEFLRLCEEIAVYAADHPRSGGVRYGEFSRSATPGWETAFAARLAPWRKMFTDI